MSLTDTELQQRLDLSRNHYLKPFKQPCAWQGRPQESERPATMLLHPRPCPSRAPRPLPQWAAIQQPAIPRNPGNRPLVPEIMAAVARQQRVGVNDILSRRRFNNIVHARQLVMWLCRKHTTHSLPEIGRRLAGKDHTTVLHGIRQVDARMDEFSSDIAAVERALGVG